MYRKNVCTGHRMWWEGSERVEEDAEDVVRRSGGCDENERVHSAQNMQYTLVAVALELRAVEGSQHQRCACLCMYKLYCRSSPCSSLSVLLFQAGGGPPCLGTFEGLPCTGTFEGPPCTGTFEGPPCTGNFQEPPCKGNTYPQTNPDTPAGLKHPVLF
eukprot:1160843-Pelagomonas_calceolata.AAC.3